MNWLFLVSLIGSIAEITPYYIDEQVVQYFKSALVGDTNKIWQKHMISFENTISVTMQETYGFKGMNVFLKRPDNAMYVSKGYYHTDNQVQIVLEDLTLDGFPHISDPMISLPLPSNVIKLDAFVSNMIVHSNYILFRNTSNIVYSLREQTAYTSPFLFEQAQKMGQLAITVEGCIVSGIGILSLTGRTVSLGNTEFRLNDCNFYIEIYTPGVESPPVIANYLLRGEGLSLVHLLMKPLEAELGPKLQAALFTYVNTSAIYLEKLPEIRNQYEQIADQTKNYINNVVRNLNILTITRNLGKMTMENFSIAWNDTFEEGVINSVVTLHNLVLTGLETVYTSHTGGPYKLPTEKLSESLRYGTLQVRGSNDIQIGEKTEEMNDFAVEMNDVEVDITCNLNTKQSLLLYKNKNNNPNKYSYTIEIMGWRSFQFSSPGMRFPPSEALITGYLQTKIPIYLVNHLHNLLPDAFREADHEYKQPGSGATGNKTCKYVCDGTAAKLSEDYASTFGPYNENDKMENGQENVKAADNAVFASGEVGRLRRKNLRTRRQKQRRN